MNARQFFLLVAIVMLVYLIVSSPEFGRTGIQGVLGIEPARPPSVCDLFDLAQWFPETSFYDPRPLRTEDDTVDECLVLYDEPPANQRMAGRPVYAVVIHVHRIESLSPIRNGLSIFDIRPQSLTHLGARVRVGLLPTASANQDRNIASLIEVKVTNADRWGNRELVILNRDVREQLVGLSVFRWDDELNRYLLVGYVHGDWLETEPDPLEGHIDEVIVCDRQYPADAHDPDRASASVFVWKDGELTKDPYRTSTRCLK